MTAVSAQSGVLHVQQVRVLCVCVCTCVHLCCTVDSAVHAQWTVDSGQCMHSGRMSIEQTLRPQTRELKSTDTCRDTSAKRIMRPDIAYIV